MLLAMFERLMATVFKAPEASTAASRLAIASKRLAAGPELQAGVVAELRGHPLGELGVGVDPGARRPSRRWPARPATSPAWVSRRTPCSTCEA